MCNALILQYCGNRYCDVMVGVGMGRYVFMEIMQYQYNRSVLYVDTTNTHTI